ncbi:unnamed protein product, partial [Brachionus calyciflorus]
MLKIKLIFLFLKLTLIKIISSSHFYGGSITWKYLNSYSNGTQDVNLIYKFYWKTTTGPGHSCDDTKITSQYLIGDNTFINCNVGCSPNSFSISAKTY